MRLGWRTNDPEPCKRCIRWTRDPAGRTATTRTPASSILEETVRKSVKEKFGLTSHAYPRYRSRGLPRSTQTTHVVGSPNYS